MGRHDHRGRRISIRLGLIAFIVGPLVLGSGMLHAGDVDYVIHISVDALHVRAVPMWGPDEVPNFWRFRTEGAYTDNARTDYARTNTTPNHTSIFTGMPINDTSPGAGDGHLWGENSANDPYASYGITVHDPHTGAPFNTSGHAPVKTAYSYVNSIFDVAHDAGLRTAHYYGKPRLNLHWESWSPKIDSHLYQPGTAYGTGTDGTPDLVSTWLTDMNADPFQYSFFHFSRTDHTGHNATWNVNPGSNYMAVVKEIDGYLGQMFNLIETDSRFAGKTAIVLTTDHAGDLGGTGHGTVTDIDNYRIPFYVWGPGVAAGEDLYRLNSQYTNPGTTRPDFSDAANQPIRNGDSPNLVLQLLGLAPIPGSTMNFSQNFALGGVPSPAVASPYTPHMDWDAATHKDADLQWEPNLNRIGSDRYFVVGGTNQPTRQTVAADPDTQGIQSAYAFNGSDVSALGSTTSIEDVAGNLTDDSASFEMWFKPDSLTGGRQVLVSLGGATDGASITLNDDVLRFQVKDSDVRAVAGGDGGEDIVVCLRTQLTDVSDFIQVVGVADLSDDDPKLALYVNGQPAGTIAGDAVAGLWIDETAATGSGSSFVRVATPDASNSAPAGDAAISEINLNDWAGTGAVRMGRQTTDVGGAVKVTSHELNVNRFQDLTFQGLIAMFNMYGTDLNAEQILANYQAIAGGVSATPTPAAVTDFAVNYDANVPLGGDKWSDRSLNVSGTRGQWQVTGATLVANPYANYTGISQVFDFNGSGGATLLDPDMSMSELIGGTVDQGDASFEIWFLPGDLSANQVLFETGGTTDGTSIRLRDGFIEFTTGDRTRSDGGTDDGRTLRFDIDVDDNDTADFWGFYQVVGVIDLDTDAAAGSEAGTLKLFVNGVEALGEAVTDYMGIDWDGGDGAGLGMLNAALGGGDTTGFVGDASFEGWISLLRIYERALSGDDVAANYAAVPEPSCLALLAIGAVALLARRRRVARSA